MNNYLVRIFVFSRGGIATWRTGVERIIAAQKLPNGLRFAAQVPVFRGAVWEVFV